MAISSHPLRRAFWLGEVDARPLALFRVAFGLIVLHDLANYSMDLGAFLTDEGMLPRGWQGESRALSIFDWFGSTAAVAAIFAVGLVAVVAFTVGYRTRLATIASWLFLTSLHTRNLYVTDGGDDLVRNLMFLAIFGDLGARYSVDAWWRRRKRALVSAVGLRMMQLHVALLYFCAGRLKLRAGWLSHNIIYQCLQLPGFVRPPGKWLLAMPSLCFLLGVATVVLELAFAFFAFSPVRVGVSRALAVACGLAVQIGILVTMRVGVFTETMIAAMIPFALPEWFDALALRFPRLAWLGPVPGSSQEQEGEESMPGRAPRAPTNIAPSRYILLAVLALHFLALAWGPFIGRRIPPPSWLVAERRWLWLEQPFGLFDVVYDVPRWEVTGIVDEGSEVDVLPIAVPALVPRVAWSFSRWYKFTFKERERPYRFAALGDFFCNRYASATGQALRSIAIHEILEPPHDPGALPSIASRRLRFEAPCVAGAARTAPFISP